MRRRRALLAGAVLLAGSALWFGTDEVLIRVHSGGGIAGRYDTVVIWESGKVLVGEQDLAWSWLTPGQHRRLRAALDAADFAHVPQPRGGVNFGHRIDYDRWSVVVTDGAGLGDVLAVPLEVIGEYRHR
ncbi:hypothetical protein OHA72_24315 [Dactylosporangium sp. NBC_01737]|uniref:hypothetical protein n=1 Tax=Dactylosporangium sp. NBC_01737 TaxID=2975959 RepID=UPI002E11AFE2|nr:hypothetical protein OHA72_24315 [Dactylosporangium sp. NBC_01737]